MLCAFMLVQEDRSLLVSLTNMTEEEEAKFGPLPAGHERRRRALIGRNSCFRMEALPPKAGTQAKQHNFNLLSSSRPIAPGPPKGLAHYPGGILVLHPALDMAALCLSGHTSSHASSALQGKQITIVLVQAPMSEYVCQGQSLACMDRKRVVLCIMQAPHTAH